jgi:hypothetical protein
MTERSARRLGWTGVGLALVLVGLAGSLWTIDTLGVGGSRPFYWEDAAAGLVLPLIGGVIIHHRPRNRIGWVILVMGLSGAIAIAGEQYAYHAAVAAPGSLPGPELAAWVTTWAWFPTYGLVPLVLLLFPEGPPGGRWRHQVPGPVVVTRADRAKDLRKDPAYILGVGTSSSHSMISQMPDLTVTAGGVSACERPTGLSGCVTTPTTSPPATTSGRDARRSRSTALSTE